MKLEDVRKLQAVLRGRKLRPTTKKAIVAFLAANAEDAPGLDPKTRIAMLKPAVRGNVEATITGVNKTAARHRARARAAVDALEGFDEAAASIDLTNFSPIDRITDSTLP